MRAAIADANALVSHGSRLNIVLFTTNGEHAAATTKRGVPYAHQTVAMRRLGVRARAIVRRGSV